MLKALIKVNLAAIVNWLTGGRKRAQNGGAKKTGKGKIILYALLMLYALGVVAWLFWQIFGLLAEPLYLAGSGWLYFVYVFILAFALMFVFSTFAAKNRLYEAKDNDLLLSMPIPPSYILFSRMTLLFGINLLCGMLVVVPAVCVWFTAAPFDALALLFAVLMFFAVALFALAISSLFGWLLSLASSKTNKKALIETIFSLVFIALYFYGYSQINQIVQNLIANNESISASMSSILPLYWIGAGAAGEVLPFVYAMLMLIIPFAVVYVILSRTFIMTATKKRSTAKVTYEAKEQKAVSAQRALLKREFARFFSSSTCIINNGLGVIFLIIASAAMLIYRDTLTELLALEPAAGELAIGICVLMASLLAGMVQPTSCSVALEGRSIWIAQTLPVSPAQVLLSKLKLSLIMYIPPVVIFMLCAVFVTGAGAETAAVAVLLPVAAVVVMAEIGLISNVNHPALNWTTESQAVKSGIAVLLCMLYDLGIIGAMGIIGYLLLNNGVAMDTVLIGFLIAFLIAARLLYSHIIHKSAEKYAFL